MSLSEPHCLITGAQGMLGRRLVEELAALGPVTGADLADFDIADAAAAADWIGRCRPDVVVHAAAMTDVDRCELEPDAARRVNAAGSLNVARAARAAGALMVAVSTDFVFDGRASEPYPEEAAPAPLSQYGASKLAGEQAVRSECPDHLIVRTAWLFGPDGRNFVRTILDAAARLPELAVVDDQVGSPTYAPDLARMIRALIENRARGTVHAVASGRASWFELACRALHLAGRATPVRPIATAELARPARRPAFSVLATRRFTELTARSPRPWPAGLADYIQLLRDRQEL